MRHILEHSKPDVVFHVASFFISSHRSDQIQQLIESNVYLGLQLLEAMVQSDVKLLVNTSTSWEHYGHDEYNPVNLYAATKKAYKQLQKFYIEARGLQAITLKLFDTYGPSDNRPKLLNLLLKAAKSGESIGLSPGYQKLDLVHIDDVVEAYIVAAERLINGEVFGHEEYGVGSGSALTIREIVKLIEKTLGKNINVKWGERSYSVREVMSPYDKYDTLSGWSPKTPIANGIEELIRSLQ